MSKKNIYKKFGFKLDDLLTQKYFCIYCQHDHIKKWSYHRGYSFGFPEIYEKHFNLRKVDSLKECEVIDDELQCSLKIHFDKIIVDELKECSDFQFRFANLFRYFCKKYRIYYAFRHKECLIIKCNNCLTLKYKINCYFRNIFGKCKKYYQNVHKNCRIGLKYLKQSKPIDKILVKMDLDKNDKGRDGFFEVVD